MEHIKGFNDYSSPLRIIILANAICFLLGGITHCLHIWTGGLFPYNSVPFGFNVFLTSLAVIDLIICGLLIARTLYGFMLGLILIAIDLPVHIYLCHNYWKECDVWTNNGVLLLMSFGVFFGLSAIYYVIHILMNKA